MVIRQIWIWLNLLKQDETKFSQRDWRGWIIIFESELQENINDTILKKYKNLIKKLSIDNRVLCICKDNKNGEYYLEECCDNYFRYTLTKEDCLQLAKLFNEIANTIEY